MFEDVSVIPIQSMAVSTRNRMFNCGWIPEHECSPAFA